MGLNIGITNDYLLNSSNVPNDLQKYVLWAKARQGGSPGLKPTLDLDFAANKSLVDNVTGQNLVSFTRASSGTYVDSTGTIRTATTNEARFDHNPSTLESLGLLVEEARTNNVSYSEHIDNAAWEKTNVIVGRNSAVAPDGSMTAVAVIPTTTSGNHFVTRFVLASGRTYSIFVKSAGYNFVAVGDGSNTFGVRFNLTAGTASILNGAVTAGIVALPDGWFRIFGTVTSNTNDQFRIFILPSAISPYDSFSGNGTSGVFVWGPQVETGSFPTSYIPTPATFTGRSSTATFYDANGIIQTAASGVARSNAFFPDSSGVMRPAGLLLEPAATNYTVNSLAGHTYNRFGISAPVTNTTETTAPDGTNTARLYIADGARNDPYIQAEVNTSSFNNYTSLTVSVYVKARTGFSGGSLRYSSDPGLDNNPFISITWNPLNYTSPTPVSSTGGTSARVEYVGNGWFRCSASYSGSNVNRTGTLQSDVRITANGTSTTNGFYVWGEQIERNLYPTSYIPTTGSTVTRAADTSTSATVTRSADVAQITGSNFSSWYNQSESTIISQFRILGRGNVGASGNYNGLWSLTPKTSFTFQGFVLSGSSYYVETNNGPYLAASGVVNNQPYKGVAALKSSMYAISGNGSTPSTSATTVPSLSATGIHIGRADAGGQNYLNGHYSRLTYWPTRLSNATLQTITAP